MTHAQSIVAKIADNSFWKDVEIPPCSTERELCVKRLYWWVTNMEQDMFIEAPFYTAAISVQVMQIIDEAILNRKSN